MNKFVFLFFVSSGSPLSRLETSSSCCVHVLSYAMVDGANPIPPPSTSTAAFAEAAVARFQQLQRHLSRMQQAQSHPQHQQVPVASVEMVMALQDAMRVCNPGMKTPFQSIEDAVNRCATAGYAPKILLISYSDLASECRSGGVLLDGRDCDLREVVEMVGQA